MQQRRCVVVSRITGWLVLCLVGSLGCAGDLEDASRFDFLLEGGPGVALDGGGTDADAAGGSNSPTPPKCVTDVLSMSCGAAACHGDETTTVDLVSPGVADRLVDVATSGATVCEGRVFISTDGSGSLLIEKLFQAMPCGSPMPLTGDALTADELTCIEQWVASLGGDT